MSDNKLSVTVVIPALNEEINLGDAIRSVTRAERVVVVDSNSTDGTRAVAEQLGAEVVQFVYREGSSEKKKNWALRTLPINSDWTLILDADERITDDLWTAIEKRISQDTHQAWALDREFVFMGRQLRCFRPNWNVRLFRTGRASYEDLGLHGIPGSGDNEIHEHMVVDGSIGYIGEAAMLHNDYRGIGPWIDRHNKYATWEAHLYARLLKEPPPKLRDLVTLDPISRKRAMRRLWARLPCRPTLRFLIWYVARRGFLDGREGLQFCVLMAWYERVILLKSRELA